MQKVILVAAPVSHYPVEEVKNPTTAEEVGRTVIECAEAGAGMVHLHVRDKDGCLTDDMTVFTKTLDVIQEGSNIVITSPDEVIRMSI